MRPTRLDLRQEQLQQQRNPRRQRGLTAIALHVSRVVLANPIGIAAPSMSRFIGQWRVSNAVNALTGSLRVARTEAIARSRPVVVCRVASSTSTTCLSAMGSNGFGSGWIVFVNYDRDANNDFAAATDELLLRQDTPPGITNISLTNAGRFVFLPNGLLNDTSNGINVEASGFSSASATPWARKGLCVTKPGRVRSVADASSCADIEK